VTDNWTQALCKVQKLQRDFEGNSYSTRQKGYPADQQMWSRGSPEFLLCSPFVSLCETLRDVQHVFPYLSTNKFTAAQRSISSGAYQSSGSFSVSGEKVALRCLYSMDSSEQWEKHRWPSPARQAVKQEWAGRGDPGTLLGLRVEV